MNKRSNRNKMALASALVVLPLLFQNCSGGFDVNQAPSLQDAGGNEGGSGGAITGGSTGEQSENFAQMEYLSVGSDYVCDAKTYGTSEAYSRRMLKSELLNTYSVLFGDLVMQDAEIVRLLKTIPDEYLGQRVETFTNAVLNIQNTFELSEALARVAFGDPNWMSSNLPNCSQTMTDACWNGFLNGLAKRVYRRPLTSTEATSLRQFASALGNDIEALKYSLIRLLSSPHFSQLLELEASVVDGERIRLSPYEVASRISYRTTGSPPDAQLILAADQNLLQTVEQVRGHAQRLLLSGSGKRHFKDFLVNWLQLDEVSDPNAIAAQQLGLSSIGLKTELATEFFRFTDHVVYGKLGSLQDLLLDKTVFATTDRVANIYGVPVFNGAGQFQDSRKGILLRPLMHTQKTSMTSPIGRGVKLRKRLLCGNLPPPPTGIIDQRDQDLAELSHLEYSNREIVSKITDRITCLGCHSQINPIGFVFEQFGPLGEVRSIERVFDENGQVLAEHQINTSIETANIPGESSLAIADAADFVDQYAESGAGQRCIAQHIHRESRLRLSQAADQCELKAMTDAIKQGKSLVDVMNLNVANESIFWRTAK